MSDDRLEWIFDLGRSGEGLAEGYDRWAERYDADHRNWGWEGPAQVAAALRRHQRPETPGPILDAGCGTGAVGAALEPGESPVVGVDLSMGMLRQAERTGRYRRLIRCSLDHLPLVGGSMAAVVSSGVFTHGHVGPEALAELCRITAPGGTISITQRADVIERYRPEAQRLADNGRWELVGATEPAPFHPCRSEADDEPALQSVLTGRVNDSDRSIERDRAAL